MTNVLALAAGTELVGDFRIERVLGTGGFGITYLADEIALARSVTIKEYFPSDFAARAKDQGAVPRSSDCSGDYKWGLDRFIEEAQTLARFDHRNICRVYRYFRANNTGYMVLHFEEGASLKDWLKGLGRAPTQAEIDAIVGPLLDALEVIHDADFLHRDIAPDNIMIRKDRSPVLIDFGSARGDIARHSRAVSALVKPGYSPYEQYAENGKQQGPWTDIYALGATLYHAITGKRPPDSPSRIVKDEYIAAKKAALASYRPRFLAAIDRALVLDMQRRPRSIAEWRTELLPPVVRQSRKVSTVEKPTVEKGRTPAGHVAEQAAALIDRPAEKSISHKAGLLEFFGGLKKRAVSKAVEPEPERVGLKPPPPPPSVQAKIEPQANHAGAVKALLPVINTRIEPKSPPQKPARAEKAPKTSISPPPPPPRQELPAAQPRHRRTGRLFGRLLARTAAALFLVTAVGVSAFVWLSPDRSASMIRFLSYLPGSIQPLPDPATVLDLKGHVGGTTGIGFAGDTVVSTGADETLKVWHARSGALQTSIPTRAGAASAFAVLDRRAITGHVDGQIVVWDLDKGEQLASFKRNEASIWSVAFAGSPDRIVAAGHDWATATWNVANPSAPVQILDGHESAVQAVAFANRGPFLATGGADRLVKLWNADTGTLLRTFRGHKDFVTAVAFSADGRLLASAGLDGNIRIWSTISNRMVASLAGHTGRVNALAFAHSGEMLASAGADGTLRLWDPRKNRESRAYPGTLNSAIGRQLKAIAFSLDGRRIAVAGDMGNIVIREIDMPATASRLAGQ